MNRRARRAQAVKRAAEDRLARRKLAQLLVAETLARQAEPSLDDLEADPEVVAVADKILRGEGGAILGIPFGPREEHGE